MKQKSRPKQQRSKPAVEAPAMRGEPANENAGPKRLKPPLTTSTQTNSMVHVSAQLPTAPTIHAPSPTGLATRPIEIEKAYSAEELTIIHTLVPSGTPDVMFKYFLRVAHETGLSAISKQVHLVKRWSAKDQRDVWTIQTGIDGFRAVADRTGCYAPSERRPEYAYDDHKNLFSVTVWIKKFTPIDRTWHEYSGLALWDEFVPMETKDGQKVMAWMWKKMPHNQLEKCAEAKGLRRGFPIEVGALRVDEEMQRADWEAEFNQAGEPNARETLQQQKREVERGTLEPGKESNRGHGQEGMEDHGPQPGARAISPAQKQTEAKQAERVSTWETLDTWVEKVEPMLKRITPQQAKENQELKVAGKPTKYDDRPYFVATCAGAIKVYAWSTHTFSAVTRAQGKDVLWKISRSYAERFEKGKKVRGKEFLSLEAVVRQGGIEFAEDPETKDYVPVTSLKTQAPAVPDRGETAPVTAAEIFGVDKTEGPSTSPKG